MPLRRGNRRGALLQEISEGPEGLPAPPPQGSWTRAEQQPILKKKLTTYPRLTRSLTSAVSICVHKLQHQNHVGNLFNTQLPAPPPKGSDSRMQSWIFSTDFRGLGHRSTTAFVLSLPNLEATENLQVCSWLPNTWGCSPGASGAASCELCHPNGPAARRRPQGRPRTGLQGARGPGRTRPSLPRSTGTREAPGPPDVTRPLAARPPQDRPVSPRPLSSHNGSSRPGNSRPGGGEPRPQRRLPPPARTLSRDTSMVEAAGGARGRHAVPGATSASRAPPPFPRWQR